MLVTTSEPRPTQEQRSVGAGIGLVVGLLLALAGCVLAAYSIGESQWQWIAFIAILLYPGLAGAIAAGSRSSDAVVAAATVLPSLGFVILARQLLRVSPSPGLGDVAVAIGVGLYFAGTLFFTLVAAVNAARRPGALRVVAGFGVGVMGVLVVFLPSLIFLVFAASGY
jgi:hypothetical protein